MPTKKDQQRIEELKKEEKRLFDTYRQNHNDEAKASHLEEMAAVIRERMTLEK